MEGVAYKKTLRGTNKAPVKDLGKYLELNISGLSYIFKNQQNALIKIKQNRLQKTLHIRCQPYMFWHQGAIIREFINNKVLYIRQVFQVPVGPTVGARTCSSWHLIYEVHFVIYSIVVLLVHFVGF